MLKYFGKDIQTPTEQTPAAETSFLAENGPLPRSISFATFFRQKTRLSLEIHSR
jgi:hypothetical protein